MRLASVVSQVVDVATPSALHTLGFAGFWAAVAGWFGILPVFAAVFAGVMGGVSYTLTVYRDPGIQTWLARRKSRRQSNKIRKLKAKQLVVNARIEALERMNAVKKEVAADVEVAKIVAAAELKSNPPR